MCQRLCASFEMKATRRFRKGCELLRACAEHVLTRILTYLSRSWQRCKDLARRVPVMRPPSSLRLSGAPSFSKMVGISDAMRRQLKQAPKLWNHLSRQRLRAGTLRSHPSKLCIGLSRQRLMARVFAMPHESAPLIRRSGIPPL